MIGILATSHPGHRIFLNESLSYLSRYNGPVILGWDDKEFIWHKKLPENIQLMVTGKKLGLQDGEMWQIKHGAEKLQNLGCKYMLKTAGDQLIKKYDNLKFLISELGEKGKIIAIHAQPGKYAIGTQLFFVEIETLLQIIKIREKLSEFLKTINGHQIHGIERLYGIAGLIIHITPNRKLREWWEKQIGLKDMQRIWILKTGKKGGRGYKETSKEYDLTENELDELPDEIGRLGKYYQ